MHPHCCRLKNAPENASKVQYERPRTEEISIYSRMLAVWAGQQSFESDGQWASVWDVEATVLALMWRDKAAEPMQHVHFCT